MKTHLTITADGTPCRLKPDASVDIDFLNPMFNDVDSFAYSMLLPIDGNRHLLENMDDKRSLLRPVSIEDSRMRIFVEGFPFFDGKLKSSDGEMLKDGLSISIDGESSLKDLIADLDCKDIPVKDNICIGQKVQQVTVEGEGTLVSCLHGKFGADKVPDDDVSGGNLAFASKEMNFDFGKQSFRSSFSPQALGFSVPYRCTSAIGNDASIASSEATGVDNYIQNKPTVMETFVNVTDPYPKKAYCNMKVAYKHYDIDDDGKTDKVVDSKTPYMVLDAERPQTGVCFYVLYFLDCLFHYLGLEWDNSALTAIEDMNRLCFVTTKCSYDEVREGGRRSTTEDPLADINRWLDTRGCGAKLSLSDVEKTDAQTVRIAAGTSVELKRGHKASGKTLSALAISTNTKNLISKMHFDYYTWGGGHRQEFTVTDKDLDLEIAKVDSITNVWKNFKVTSAEASLSNMYANSGNFPDTSVSEVLTSLENMFGIRFVYEAEKKKVTAKLLRDIYRDRTLPINFLGRVTTMSKVSEKITGVRVMYSCESELKEQRDNLRDKTRDYDTEFDYIDYPDPSNPERPSGTALARTTKIVSAYSDIPSPTNTDNTLYIDRTTGNAYRNKVDKEASTSTELHPVRFEVGAFKGAEFGDCSKVNEDFIMEMSTSFEPVRLSCVNPTEAEIGMAPRMIPFMDVDMEHEYVPQSLSYPFDTVNGKMSVDVMLHLKENYSTRSSDDGNSPLQSHDWGLCIGIMRGGGSDAGVQEYDSDFDGFGNSRWRTVAGSYALTADSIDFTGGKYDYDGGANSTLGTGERFSLKPRAYKQPDWAEEPICNPDSHTAEGWYYVKSRGYADRFLSEHAMFVVNRRKFVITAQCSPAFIADIPNHWFQRFRINGEIGYINKVSATASVYDGMKEVEIEFFAI